MGKLLIVSKKRLGFVGGQNWPGMYLPGFIFLGPLVKEVALYQKGRYNINHKIDKVDLTR